MSDSMEIDQPNPILSGFKVINFCQTIEDRHTVLIEIQANIEHTIEKKFNFMYLGKLTKTGDTSYNLSIGNHVIAGKLVKLKNPFILCLKSKKEDNTIRIVQLIETKIQFSNRPTPLLTAGKKKNKK